MLRHDPLPGGWGGLPLGVEVLEGIEGLYDVKHCKAAAPDY